MDRILASPPLLVSPPRLLSKDWGSSLCEERPCLRCELKPQGAQSTCTPLSRCLIHPVCCLSSACARPGTTQGWLAIQMPTEAGLQSAPAEKRRYEIMRLNDAPEALETALVEEWGQSTALDVQFRVPISPHFNLPFLYRPLFSSTCSLPLCWPMHYQIGRPLSN